MPFRDSTTCLMKSSRVCSPSGELLSWIWPGDCGTSVAQGALVAKKPF